MGLKKPSNKRLLCRNDLKKGNEFTIAQTASADNRGRSFELRVGDVIKIISVIGYEVRFSVNGHFKGIYALTISLDEINDFVIAEEE